MTNEEINVLFQFASDYAENSYYEIFNRHPDTSKTSTQEIIAMMMHAWLSGYYYLSKDKDLNNTLYEVFNYTCEIEY